MHTGHRCGGGGCLRGALPSLTMLTLGCLSTLATNEIDPGALAHTEVAPFTQQGLSINQTGAKKKKKLYLVNVLLSEWISIESHLFQLFHLPVDFVKRSSFSKCMCECVHMLTLLCTVCAVPKPALLLVSGVLECWKHLAGRFNIQLTGSHTSYITAENPPPPTPPTPLAIILISWLVPHPLPLPLEWSLHPSPLSPVLRALLSSVFVLAARG